MYFFPRWSVRYEQCVGWAQTELESREKEVLAVTAEREQLEAKAAASQSENAHLRLLVDELRVRANLPPAQPKLRHVPMQQKNDPQMFHVVD